VTWEAVRAETARGARLAQTRHGAHAAVSRVAPSRLVFVDTNEHLAYGFIRVREGEPNRCRIRERRV